MILCSSHVTLIWIWLELTLLVAEVKGSFLYRWILVADMLLDVRLTVPLVVIDCLIHFRSAPLPLLLVVQCQDPAACHQLPTAPSGPQWSSGPHFGGCCSQAIYQPPDEEIVMDAKFVGLSWLYRTGLEVSCGDAGSQPKASQGTIPIGSMYAVYGNIYHTWILWV